MAPGKLHCNITQISSSIQLVLRKTLVVVRYEHYYVGMSPLGRNQVIMLPTLCMMVRQSD